MIVEATAGGTYRDEMWRIANTIRTYIAQLSPVEIEKCFVIFGTFYCRLTHYSTASCGFVGTQSLAGDMNIQSLLFGNSKANCNYSRMTGGSMIIEDRSNVSSSMGIKFYAP